MPGGGAFDSAGGIFVGCFDGGALLRDGINANIGLVLSAVTECDSCVVLWNEVSSQRVRVCRVNQLSMQAHYRFFLELQTNLQAALPH